MNKHITRILAIVMATALVFGMTACGGNTDAHETTADPTETTAPPTTEPVNVCETDGHAWVDANYQQPKTCSVCAATEGEALVSYFSEHGLDAKLLDKSGEYDYPLPCGLDATKTTVSKVTVSDYKTIASDETHEAMDGYEWKILTIKLHFSDENAQAYGLSMGKYLWADRYEADTNDNDDEDGIIDELFTTGMAQSFTWNGVEYNDGLLHITESVTEWLQDDAGAYYLDIFVTVSVRVPVGYDGFVFGLETTDWEWPDGTYLHEVITDATVMFCLD